MRIDVNKFLFFGIPESMGEFFSKAQQIGQIQFIDKTKRKVKDVSASTQEVINAIKVLRGLPSLEEEELDKISQGEEITQQVLDLKSEIEKLEEEKRITTLEISRIEAFGNFSLDDIAYIEKETGRVVQFFFAKKGHFERSELPCEVFFVDSDHGLDYFMTLNEATTQYDDMVEMRIEHGLSALQERLSEINLEIYTTFTELKGYSKYNAFLHSYLESVLDGENLENSKDRADMGMDGALFVVEGWIPKDKVSEVEQLVSEMDVQMVAIAIDEEQVAPTHLENEGLNKVGEDLVHIYDTPANTDRDPSIWVLFSFALFFAMIIGDGGYGLVFLAGALYMKFKAPNLKSTGLRMWKLLMILCVSCVAWGVMTNSFFGVSFGPESTVREYSVLNYLTEKKAAYHIAQEDVVHQEWVNKFPELSTISDPQLFLRGAKKGDSFIMLDKLSDSILMEIALIIGIIHICISFIRYIDRSWAGIGWIIAIVGCFLYLPEFLQATTALNYVFGLDKIQAAQEGWLMIWGGMGLALGLSLIQNRLMGLLEITIVIQIFADVLSYLRLYALGLAGGIISATVNDLAGSMMFVFAIPLIIFGHSLNMVLSVIGGVIHGLRLNFIEWYHYSFEGGGKLFDPLRKLNIEN